ncbi:MAG: Uma2 family endonuclease [Planctomycetota bacterium]|nr:MAG: Uma2 family endonuclease [Planctomycetota bacterium]
MPPVVGQPAWDVALLYPLQGGWSEEEYLSIALTRNRLIEYTNGCVEVLPMPTVAHQLIVRFLLDALRAFVEPNLGVVLFAPLPVWTVTAKYREPDLIFHFTESHTRRAKQYYEGADLVMEVVSDDPAGRQRDYETKRRDYAEAGIPEYWIVDPQQHRIAVLTLDGGRYVEHAYAHGGTAESRLLNGFSVDVDAVFAAGRR